MVVRRVGLLLCPFPPSPSFRIADIASFRSLRSKREFTSFDTPNVAATKAHYIRDQGLGGAMYWELDAVSRSLFLRRLFLTRS